MTPDWLLRFLGNAASHCRRHSHRVRQAIKNQITMAEQSKKRKKTLTAADERLRKRKRYSVDEVIDEIFMDSDSEDDNDDDEDFDLDFLHHGDDMATYDVADPESDTHEDSQEEDINIVIPDADRPDADRLDADQESQDDTDEPQGNLDADTGAGADVDGTRDPPPRNRYRRAFGPVPWQTLSWVEAGDIHPQEIPFTGDPGIKVDTTHFAPIDYFNLFMGPEIIAQIAEQTNLFAQQVIAANQENMPPHSRMRKWEPTNPNEIRRFLGLCLLMGIVKKPHINLYWTKDPLIRTHIFGQVMPRDRFLLIMKFLHFNDNASKPPDADRMWKLKPLLDHLNERFTEVYTPRQTVSIDESLILFKGRLFFKQYLPLKRARFGVKAYFLCEDSGYISRFRVYQGKEDAGRLNVPDDARDMLKSEQIVVALLDGFLGKGYHVYHDNWYTSVLLAEYLLKHDTASCGTVKANRAPKVLRDKAVNKDEVYAVRLERNKNVMALKWKDKKDVRFISTIHTAERAEGGKRTPLVATGYNRHMGGVDRKDQRLQPYDCTRKTYKWYKKVGLYFIQCSELNSFFVAKEDGTTLTYLQFQLSVIDSLLQQTDAPTEEDDDVRLQGRHFPEILEGTGTRPRPTKRCRVCYRRDHLRRESRYICPDCPSHPGLCLPDCFRTYHTQRQYWHEE